MSQASKLALIKEMIDSAESSLRSAKQLLTEIVGSKSVKSTYSKLAENLEDPEQEGDDNIVEGIYNGQVMIDKNKKEYPIPANYASKSKLIPGDVLKLTIKADGSFVYKQIGPAPRKRIMGTLTYEDSQYKVIASGKAYKVLLASVTYFKGEIGNKVTIVVPEAEDSEWAAIENVLPLEPEKLDI